MILQEGRGMRFGKLRKFRVHTLAYYENIIYLPRNCHKVMRERATM